MNKKLWDRVQQTTIPPDKIPDTIDLSKVLEKFNSPSYNIGGWPTSKSTKSSSPPFDEMTHVIRGVSVNDDNGLNVKFEILNSLRGYEFELQYMNNAPFEMVPVTDDSGINILRFDFVKEK